MAKNLGADPFRHFGAPGGHFGFCRRCDVAGDERVPPSPQGWYYFVFSYLSWLNYFVADFLKLPPLHGLLQLLKFTELLSTNSAQFLTRPEINKKFSDLWQQPSDDWQDMTGLHANAFVREDLLKSVQLKHHLSCSEKIYENKLKLELELC